jgi:hypothetical protein
MRSRRRALSASLTGARHGLVPIRKGQLGHLTASDGRADRREEGNRPARACAGGAPLLDLLGAVNRSRPSIFDWRSGPYRQPCERPGADAPHRAVRRRFWAPAGRSICHKVTGRRRPEGRDPASGASPLLPYRLTLRPLPGQLLVLFGAGEGIRTPDPNLGKGRRKG